ncbi:hypothetical protein [Gordonia tangerina]|uniref:Uncharacterized protein n=1 Tax=Gordonia tangerina TaxID=2911060 RepID=A0ABS9DJ06_9ACTN|nr:hypothetical protein [Gordonia tangerina]MCF3939073.1 hypothetical protein [Gordonia tangerina]
MTSRSTAARQSAGATASIIHAATHYLDGYTLSEAVDIHTAGLNRRELVRIVDHLANALSIAIDGDGINLEATIAELQRLGDDDTTQDSEPGGG